MRSIFTTRAVCGGRPALSGAESDRGGTVTSGGTVTGGSSSELGSVTVVGEPGSVVVEEPVSVVYFVFDEPSASDVVVVDEPGSVTPGTDCAATGPAKTAMTTVARAA